MGECSRRSLKTFVLLSLVILANFQIGASQSNEATVKSLVKTAPNNPRIVIIGAGVAGIAAASKLFQNGFKNVTILEAENRIGGRINTTKLGDYTVELGAQWVYGDDGNVAFKLVKDLGVIDKSEQTDNLASRQYLDSQGNPVDETLTKNITEFYINNVRNAKFGNTTADQSLGEYVEKLFDEQFGDRSEIMKEKKKLLHHLESSIVSLEYAESWRDITASGGYQHRKFSGDQMSHWKNQGYSTILDILMKRYPDAEKELPVMKNTILNTEVMSIDYLQDVVGPPVFITTTKGQLYKADHVIVTVSLGVLKAKHMSLFIPPLPDFKVKTIESLGFGNIAKIYLLFEKPFWELGDKKVVQFNFLWNDADRDLIEADLEKMWVLGLSKVTTVQHKPNLLELWVAGKYAKSMELLTDDKVLNHTIETLQRFLYKQYTVSAPKAMLRSRWYTNPHFRGTTSYRSIEAQKIKVHSEMVEKPLFPQNLTILFAGEATVKDKYATVDGAIASGWKAANRLLDHYKKQLPIPE